MSGFTCPQKRPCAPSVSEIVHRPDALMSAVLMCEACSREILRHRVQEQVVVVSRQEKVYKAASLLSNWRQTL
jgi:hypothetical protein